MTPPGSWRRHASLLVCCARLNLARHFSFRASLVFEQLSYLVQLVLSLAVWKHLFTRLPAFEGWTFDSLLVLHFFGNVFLALFHSLFMGWHSFHGPITSGNLDGFLSRPVDPRIAHLAQQFRPEELVNRLLALIPLVFVMAARGVTIEPGRLAMGLTVMLLGLAAFSLIQLTLTYAAFWFVRGDVILSFLDLFYGFYRYPLNALPWVAQTAMALLTPVVLAVTYPALFATGLAGGGTLLATAAAALAVFLLWLPLEEWLWRRGLEAYQSPGG